MDTIEKLDALTGALLIDSHIFNAESWLCSCVKPSVRDCPSWYYLLVGNIHSSVLMEKLLDTGLGMNFYRTCISFTETPITFQ